MWHLPGFLFHSCFIVQGQVRILLSNFYKLCPSHTPAESSENKSYVQQGIKVLTYGLSAGLTTTLRLQKLYPDMVSYWNHLTCTLHLNKDDNNYFGLYLISFHNNFFQSGKKSPNGVILPQWYLPVSYKYLLKSSLCTVHTTLCARGHSPSIPTLTCKHTPADFTSSVSVWELWDCRRGC